MHKAVQPVSSCREQRRQGDKVEKGILLMPHAPFALAVEPVRFDGLLRDFKGFFIAPASMAERGEVHPAVTLRTGEGGDEHVLHCADSVAGATRDGRIGRFRDARGLRRASLPWVILTRRRDGRAAAR